MPSEVDCNRSTLGGRTAVHRRLATGTWAVGTQKKLTRLDINALGYYPRTETRIPAGSLANAMQTLTQK